MNTLQYLILLIVFVFMPVMQVKSQDSMKPDTVGATVVTSDTIIARADTLEASTDTLKYLKHSPSKAALYSAILPGLGQIYNKKYWKLPIVYVGLGVAGYYLQRNLKLYHQYLKGYQNFSNNHDTAAIAGIPLINQYTDKLGALQFYTNTYRTYRDWSYFAVSLIYVLNIIDASVDAYFFYYDISDNLSLKVKPTLLNTVGNYSVVGLKLSFDIH